MASQFRNYKIIGRYDVLIDSINHELMVGFGEVIHITNQAQYYRDDAGNDKAIFEINRIQITGLVPFLSGHDIYCYHEKCRCRDQGRG